MKKKPMLFVLFAFSLISSLLLSSCISLTYVTKDGTELACKPGATTDKISCQVICPDPLPFPGQKVYPEISLQFDADASHPPQPSDYTYSQLQDQGCAKFASVPSFNSENVDASAPTDPPVQQPVATSTTTPTASPVPVVPLNAYLTGAFTTCDSTTRYVNFLIAKDAPAYDPATFKLLFNGQPAQCTPIDNSDPRVLSCTYPPAPNNPPASIQVFIGTEQVNDFTFEGGMICDPVHHNNNQPVVAPTPTP